VDHGGEVSSVVEDHVEGLACESRRERSATASKDLNNQTEGNQPSGNEASDCSMHQRNSSSVSPFQAKTGTPVAAMAAAAWS
jgi:hypothetical protein